MDRAVVDLGEDICADGQAYVALSRVKTLDGLATTGLCEDSIRMVSPAASEAYVCLGVDRYTHADANHASQRAASLPSRSEHLERDADQPERMDVDREGMANPADHFPLTPPRPQLPMRFARSPHSSPQNSSVAYQSLGWAASALTTASRRKRQRIRSVASEIQSQTQGSDEEGAGNGGEAQGPGRCLRRLSSEFTPLPRFSLNSPSRWVSFSSLKAFQWCCL